MTGPGEPLAGIDVDRANAARMYDYFLGGAHNFAVDRERAATAMQGHPNIRHLARANRAYLGRVVQWCLGEGIDQFVDLGSGVPTVGNVHEIAHRRDPAVRVAYVDVEPVAVAHAREIVAGIGTVSVTHADLRDDRAVLTAPGVADLIDLDRPVALLAIAVLHFVEGDVGELLGRYRAHLVPGSVVAISHSSADHEDPEVAGYNRATQEAYRESATPLVLRSRAELRAALGDLEPVEPGIVDVVHWPGPQPDVTPTAVYAAVTRVR